MLERLARVGWKLVTVALLFTTVASDEGGGGAEIVQAALTGDIGVRVESSGADIPTIGYLVHVGDRSARVNPMGGFHRFDLLPPGTYLVSLSDVPPNCTVQPPHPRSVTVTAGDDVNETFNVTCERNVGDLLVTAQTFGPLGGATEYTVFLVGKGIALPLPVNGSVLFEDLEPGDYEVQLVSLPFGCSVAGSHPRALTVQLSRQARVDFRIDCAGAAGIRIRTVTQGADLDPDGYLVRGLGDTPAGIGSNDEIVLGVPAGVYDVQLTSLSANCTVAGDNPQTVMVGPGVPPEVVFTVNCVSSNFPACTGTTAEDFSDGTFAGPDWTLEPVYQTNPGVQWGMTAAQTPPGPGGNVPTGNPDPPARWVNLTLSNPGGVSTGVGAASQYVPGRVSGQITSIRVEFDVWATTVRVQAYIKQNNTFYGIPMGRTVNEADGWVTIATECGVADQIGKIGGQTGQGPDVPDFSQPFEVGYVTQASGPGVASNRHIIVDNWRVRIWR